MMLSIFSHLYIFFGEISIQVLRLLYIFKKLLFLILWWLSLGTIFLWAFFWPISGLALFPTQTFLWEQQVRGQGLPQREVSPTWEPGPESFALRISNLLLEQSRRIELEPVSGWLQLSTCGSPKHEMPVLRRLCLGWESSWPSAWCREWAVPPPELPLGPQSLGFSRRICCPQATWQLESFSTHTNLSAD